MSVFCLFLSVSLCVFVLLYMYDEIAYFTVRWKTRASFVYRTMYVLCVCLWTSVVWNKIDEWMNEWMRLLITQRHVLTNIVNIETVVRPPDASLALGPTCMYRKGLEARQRVRDSDLLCSYTCLTHTRDSRPLHNEAMNNRYCLVVSGLRKWQEALLMQTEPCSHTVSWYKQHL